MENENIKEYESIRIEMMNLKDCITKYVGYVLAGSGAMIYGIARVEGSISQTVNSPAIAVITAAFSMLISLVLLLLFYKFNSHNRFAGFCKLLNHECHEPLAKNNHGKVKGKQPNDLPEEKDRTTSIFSWEVTVGDLRWLESTPQDLGNIISKIIITEPDNKEIKKKIQERVGVYGKKPSIDAYSNIKGLGILLKTLLLRNVQTDSWAFPPLIVCIFLFLSFGFLFASYVVIYSIGITGVSALLVFEAIITVFHLFLWLHLCGKLFSLMNGSTTVYSFFWKFIPLRTLFLNKYNIMPSYISIEDYVFTQPNR